MSIMNESNTTKNTIAGDTSTLTNVAPDKCYEKRRENYERNKVHNDKHSGLRKTKWEIRNICDENIFTSKLNKLSEQRGKSSRKKNNVS